MPHGFDTLYRTETVTGQRIIDVARSLMQGGKIVNITLEPGDCTRYELGLALDRPVGWNVPTLLIIRYRGGYASSASTVSIADHRGYMDVRHVGEGNPHTEEIFSWWIGQLVAILNDENNDNGN